MHRFAVRPLGLLVLYVAIVGAQPVDLTIVTALTQELKEKEIPGGVVGVLDGGQITCLAAVGTANIETGEPVTTDMLFRLGSTTKMFVATTALYDGALPLIHVGEILTLRKGRERIPLQIIDDSTASNGFQRIVFGRDPDGAIQRLYYEWYTLKRQPQSDDN